MARKKKKRISSSNDNTANRKKMNHISNNASNTTVTKKIEYIFKSIAKSIHALILVIKEKSSSLAIMNLIHSYNIKNT